MQARSRLRLAEDLALRSRQSAGGYGFRQRADQGTEMDFLPAISGDAFAGCSRMKFRNERI